MGIYSKYVLPRVVHHVCGQKPAMKQRGKIIPQAAGRVLEIGIGSGLNIPYYNSGRVSHLWGLDPSREAWAIARRNAREHHLDAEFIESGAESIPLGDDSADTVVMTYTLCTIPDAVAALEPGYEKDGLAGAMSGLADWKHEQFGVCDPFNLSAAGETDEALDCLELRVEMGDPNMPYIGVTVTLRALRDEPRFQDLLRRMNLPAS